MFSSGVLGYFQLPSPWKGQSLSFLFFYLGNFNSQQPQLFHCGHTNWVGLKP